MKFMTDNGEVSEAVMDGYHIGDRQLEGVRFVFTIENNDLKVRVHKDDNEYFTQFNQEYWYNEALEHIDHDPDCLESNSGDGEPVWIED